MFLAVLARIETANRRLVWVYSEINIAKPKSRMLIPFWWNNSTSDRLFRQICFMSSKLRTTFGKTVQRKWDPRPIKTYVSCSSYLSKWDSSVLFGLPCFGSSIFKLSALTFWLKELISSGRTTLSVWGKYSSFSELSKLSAFETLFESTSKAKISWDFTMYCGDSK